MNIERVLDGWEVSHAVRELIANALDEAALTHTAPVEVRQDTRGCWHIRDFGRGLTYEHLTQNENTEKRANPGLVIGRFGVGLKDALGVLHRHGVAVTIRSSHGVITLTERAKAGFSDVVTLHARVSPPGAPQFVGTTIELRGVADDDVATAQRYFLAFSGDRLLEATRFGHILERAAGRPARVYVNGLVVAEEERFAFSYNLTTLTEAMRKALNRERTNVGRVA